jgi:hypothetical protein
MKVFCLLALIIFCAFAPVYAYSDYDMEQKVMQPRSGYAQEEKQEADNPPVAVNTDANTPAVTDNSDNNMEEKPVVKTKYMCIGGDCRSQWPILRCRDYADRPAGETGDEYCGKRNKTCMAVSIGGGQSFFDQCSVPVNSVHKCRCCWVQ